MYVKENNYNKSSLINVATYFLISFISIIGFIGGIIVIKNKIEE